MIFLKKNFFWRILISYSKNIIGEFNQYIDKIYKTINSENYEKIKNSSIIQTHAILFKNIINKIIFLK